MVIKALMSDEDRPTERPDTIIPEPGSVWIHFKGRRYKVVGTARHSETGELMVVYEPLYENPWPLCVRPIWMWSDHVEREGYSGPRFRLEKP